jgi:serine/threonine protein kinase
VHAPEVAREFPLHPLHGTEALALLTDRCLDDYSDRRQLSSAGANHMVWQAVDQQTGLPCVLKEFRSAERGDSRQWLRRQAHVMARLRHPNVLHVQAVFREKESFYIQSPLLAGGSLTDWINGCKEGRGCLGQVRQLVRGIVLGLHCLHGEGIIHRDLKPDNVVLNRQGQPVLIDFEHCVDSKLATLRTAAGLTVGLGTFGFMAPELLEGKAATAASDIYALGKIIDKLCGAWEQRGDGKAPSELRAAVGRMLLQDPNARPTAMDLLGTPLLCEEWGEEQDTAVNSAAALALQKASAARRMVRAARRH